MFRATVKNMAKMHKRYEETTYKGRRLAAQPQPYFMQARRGNFQSRIRDVGPEFHRVWVTLGGQMRRRRAGRQRDQLDERYYFRPVHHATQALYLNRFRWRAHDQTRMMPARLHALPTDIGHASSGIEWRNNRHAKYGARVAAALPHDWEFRVF